MALPAWIAASAPVNAIMRPSPVVLTTHSPELLRDPAQGHEATAHVRVRLLIAERLVERRAVAHIDEHHRTVRVGGRNRITAGGPRAVSPSGSALRPAGGHGFSGLRRTFSRHTRLARLRAHDKNRNRDGSGDEAGRISTRNIEKFAVCLARLT
jgi:hypothetical protein